MVPKLSFQTQKIVKPLQQAEKYFLNKHFLSISRKMGGRVIEETRCHSYGKTYKVQTGKGRLTSVKTLGQVKPLKLLSKLCLYFIHVLPYPLSFSLPASSQMKPLGRKKHFPHTCSAQRQNLRKNNHTLKYLEK